ncbi:MAG TPA: prolyl oligopeptidase family serine peptidase, partial [Steroidobacteraceae bacterium]|nr:prolyl oligopeptidase family serine peptidase [Steroidobacteraceae bacterium]
NTVDPAGAATTASAAMMIPTGSDATCQGPRPVVLYAHGTAAQKTLNLADISNEDNLEGLLAATMFTTQGYVLIAPNYTGYDISTLTYNPYLNADQESKDMVDALTAARSALPAPVTDSGKLFVTGYSQGGHVAMATHKLLQETGAAITASAPMSGPYAVAAFADAVFFGEVTRTTPLFLVFTSTGYQKAYGDVYTSPTDLFEARYATGIETLLPSAVPRTQLFAEGKLPRDQLFDSTPPDPAFAPFTPATTPANLASVFAQGFGPDHLVTNAFRLSYLQDAQANPDGSFPTVLDNRPAANPANGLRRAFKRNDLRVWVPTAPVFLCGGADDPTVLFMNTQLIQAYWSANGVTAPVTVLDLESPITSSDPDAARKAAFAVAKEAIEADGGDAAVQESYHSTLVPPFCLSAVKSFFDGL